MGIYIGLVYLLIMSVYTFILMGMDKQFAIKHKRRIPEKRLFTLSALGGAIGTWVGMSVWRHKTKHASFKVGIPLLLLFNLVAVYYITGFIE